MTTPALELDGSPCQFKTVLATSVMRCVQVDCDGTHHYLVGI